jgi:hypothetical protein
MIDPRDPTSPFYGYDVPWDPLNSPMVPTQAPPPVIGGGGPAAGPATITGGGDVPPPVYHQPQLLGPAPENPLVAALMGAAGSIPFIQPRPHAHRGEAFLAYAAPILGHGAASAYDARRANLNEQRNQQNQIATKGADRQFELDKMKYGEDLRVNAADRNKVTVAGPDGLPTKIDANIWASIKARPGAGPTVNVRGPDGKMVPVSANAWYSVSNRANPKPPKFDALSEADRAAMSTADAAYKQAVKDATFRAYQNKTITPADFQATVMSGVVPPVVYQDMAVVAAHSSVVQTLKHTLSRALIRAEASGDPSAIDEVASLVVPGDPASSLALSQLILEAPASLFPQVAALLEARPELNNDPQIGQAARMRHSAAVGTSGAAEVSGRSATPAR